MSQKLVKKIVINQRETQKNKFNVKNVTQVISSIVDKLIQIVAELNKRGKLHGIDHFVNIKYHPLERFLWLSLICAAFGGVFFIGNSQMERFRANPTVISLERGRYFQCA